LLDSARVNVTGLKGRIAQALVEGIFRRAGYQIGVVGGDRRNGHAPRATDAGLLPDLLVWKPAAGSSAERPHHRLVALQVRYRGDVERAVPRDSARLAPGIAQWADLHLVYVTDHPQPGRSCFQTIDARQCPLPPGAATIDLHEATALDVWWPNVQEHERLVTLVFPVLSGARRAPRRLASAAAV
jgi:hypothetical protein